MTTQVKERIIIDGEKYPLLNALSLPENDTKIKQKEGPTYTRSSCWRGYVGTWEIKDDKLYLTDLSSSNYEFIHSPPFLADWFNGQIKFGTGNKKLSSSWVSVYDYEFEIHLTIVNGLVIEDIIFKNTSFR